MEETNDKIQEMKNKEKTKKTKNDKAETDWKLDTDKELLIK